MSEEDGDSHGRERRWRPWSREKEIAMGEREEKEEESSHGEEGGGSPRRDRDRRWVVMEGMTRRRRGGHGRGRGGRQQPWEKGRSGERGQPLKRVWDGRRRRKYIYVIIII